MSAADRRWIVTDLQTGEVHEEPLGQPMTPAEFTRGRFTPDEPTRRELVIAANQRADRLAGRIVAAERAVRSGQSSTVVLAILGGSDDEQEERA